jgi:hypothetical protein
MSGRFGLLGHPHDDLVATEKLVEANPVVDIFRLYREGLLSPGASGMVDTGTGGCRPARHKAEISELEIDGQSLRIGWHSHLPLPTFICGACGRTCYRAHQVGGLWACRLCHRLTYLSRHRNRTIPGLNRVRYLRRRLGADPRPFTPLPVKPLHARKHWKLASEIRALERALLHHARRDVVEVLERRHAKQS